MSFQYFWCFHLVILTLSFVYTSSTDTTEYKDDYLPTTSSPISQLTSDISNDSMELTKTTTMDILDYLDTFQSTTPQTSLFISDTDGTREFNITIPPYDLFEMNITVHKDTMFFLVQSHSFYHYLEMTSDNITIKGTNIGVVYCQNNSFFTFSIKNFNRVSVNALVFITAYNKYAPVPGANCPANELIMAVPHLHIYLNKIKFDAVPAVAVNLENKTCSSDVTYRLFYKYTSERDISEKSYFEGLRSMKSLSLMIKNANEYKLPNLNNNANSSVNVTFANYPGNGIIFGLVAESTNGSSIYVLTHTFGCNFTADLNSCFFLVNTFLRVEMVILCVTGLILCCCGYEWKTLELALMAFLLFGIPTYTALYNYFPLEDNVMISTTTGIVLSFAIIFIVWYTKNVHLRHAVAFFTLGMLMSAVVMYLGVGNSAPFKSESIYWMTFFVIAMSIVILLYMNRSVSHYFTSAIIGSLLAVLTIDYFSGTSIKYIVYDNIRRINVENFMEANIDPPFQTPDVILAVLWVVVGVASVVYQCFFVRLYNVGLILNPDVQSITDFIETQVESESERCDDKSPLITHNSN